MREPLLFTTNNQHKVDEVKRLVPARYEVISLADLNWKEDIPEPYDTFHENAMAKTNYLFERTSHICFAEDSGLAIDALDGRPGVYSARYAGGHGNSAANIQKVLTEMNGIINRSARFISLIAFQTNATTVNLFQGTVEGDIAQEISGIGGFGYDPIFIPKGFHQTFGVLDPAIKDRISHRSRSMQLFLSFLTSQSA